jgi:hypothetical protein
MNQRDLAILLIGAAVPVILPIILREIGNATARLDEGIENNDIINELVNSLVVPVAERVLAEIKTDRSAPMPEPVI